jgi:hypothetical protein
VKLDFQEKTITIDEILLPMRNIANLQLKPRVTRALRENTCFAPEPIHTGCATKRMVKIKKPFSKIMKEPDTKKKLAPKLKKLELNCTNLMLNSKNTRSDCAKMPDPSISSGLYVKNKSISVLLDSGSSGDLLFMKKRVQ